jgi:hypothetical protein
MRTAAGYTAIELVLALAATSIVGALVFSAFRTHSIRAQVASGIELAWRWGEVVEMRFRADGRVPQAWEDVGAGPETPTSSYVKAIQLVNGRVDILYGQEAATAIAGRRVSLTPYETADQQVVWICGNDIPGLGLEPLGFASGTTQPVQVPATIAARYLPAGCR